MSKKGKAGTSKAAAAQRRALFVEAYCENGGNATKAAITAGYSRKTARAQGSRLLTGVDVAKAIAERRAAMLVKAQAKTDLTAEEVLRSLARDIRFDPAKLCNADGSFKALHELDEDTRLALRGIDVVEMAGGMGGDGEVGVKHVPMYTRKLKFPEKTAAREQGMKHFGLYEADNTQKPPTVLAPGVRTVKFEPFKGRRAQAPR